MTCAFKTLNYSKYFSDHLVQRGTIAERLERLGNGEESHHKVEFKAGLCYAMTGKLSLSTKW